MLYDLLNTLDDGLSDCTQDCQCPSLDRDLNLNRAFYDPVYYGVNSTK